MARLQARRALVILLLAAGCASAPVAPPPAPADACASAWQEYRAELSAAAENCLSDQGCVAFGTCNAVTRGREPAVQDLKARAQSACAPMHGSHVHVECAPRPIRCVARRCLRF